MKSPDKLKQTLSRHYSPKAGEAEEDKLREERLTQMRELVLAQLKQIESCLRPHFSQVTLEQSDFQTCLRADGGYAVFEYLIQYYDPTCTTVVAASVSYPPGTFIFDDARVLLAHLSLEDLRNGPRDEIFIELFVDYFHELEVSLIEINEEKARELQRWRVPIERLIASDGEKYGNQFGVRRAFIDYENSRPAWIRGG